MPDGGSYEQWWQTEEERKKILERERQQRKEKEEERLKEIEEGMKYAYTELRIWGAFLERLIAKRGDELTEEQSKRTDKALVVMKTGFKMLKKVIRSRQPDADTSAWKRESQEEGHA
jgi:hypothetical protein